VIALLVLAMLLVPAARTDATCGRLPKPKKEPARNDDAFPEDHRPGACSEGQWIEVCEHSVAMCRRRCSTVFNVAKAKGQRDKTITAANKERCNKTCDGMGKNCAPD
jgi:hypothetical protein